MINEKLLNSRKQEITDNKIIKKIKKETQKSDNKILAVIRISGMVKVKNEIEETLNRLKLKRKYSCVLINSKNESIMGMLKKVKFYVAYGEINRDTLIKLINARSKSIEGDKKEIKSDSESVADSLHKGKKLKDFNLKPFFRLHSPRKGINSKLQYPKGVLGNNGIDINKLIERML